MSRTARLQVLLASLCFGTTGTAQALGPDGLSPAGVGAGRIFVGGALLVLVALLTSGGLTALPKRPLLLAAGAVATYQLSFFAAVHDTGVAVGTIVALGSAPALAGGIEWAVERRAPTRAWAAATALACAGVAMLALAGAERRHLAPRRRPRAVRGRVVRRVHAGGQADAPRALARDRHGGRVRARRRPAAAGARVGRRRARDARRARR